MKRWLVATAGYLAYTLAILVFLLWWRFPAPEVAAWCEARLHARYPALSWKIGSLQWEFPDRMRLSHIQARAGQVKMMEIDSLHLTLDLTSLFRKKRRITYEMQLFGGTGTGRISLASGHDLVCQGRFSDLKLDRMQGLALRLNRAVRGGLGATFSWQGSWPELNTKELSGMVRIDKGLLPLRKPVLGLKELDFSRLEAGVSYQDQAWMVDKGVLEAKTMHVSFTGKVVPGPNLGLYHLHFSGKLTPRAELFRTVGSRELAMVIRGFLSNGALPLKVTGTAAEPAVELPGGLSAALRRLHARGGG